MASSIRSCPECGKPIRGAMGCCGQRQPETTWALPAFEATIERRFRQFAIPLALVIAWGMVHSGFARMVLRTFFSMWVHELGHAMAAWLCGRFAFPGPWFTPIGSERSIGMVLVVAGALGVGAFRLWGAQSPWAIAVGGLLPLQLFCSFGLSEHKAVSFMVWSGDGGCMILGTLLMLSLYARKESQLRVGWLRWGFLAIGAVAFADAFATWWAARTDRDAIPFGENEGRGPSDPTVLVYQQGFTIPGLVNGYVLLGAACLTILTVAYTAGLRAKAGLSAKA